MKNIFPYIATRVAAITFIAHSAFALAQQNNPSIEEIVITADFFNTPLMQSANSVSVISTNTIQMRGAQHLEETFSLIPNLNWSSGGSRTRFVQLRGIGDLEQFQDPKYYPSVGINLDNIELGSNVAAASLFGVEQIEILRGPQGTRFGSSGHAGLINLKSIPPTAKFNTTISTGFGNYGQRNFGLSTSGALRSNLRGRLTSQQNQGNGFVQNRFLNIDDSNAYKEKNLRGMLDWQTSDSLSFKFNLIHFNSENGYDAWSLDGNRDTESDQPGENKNKLYATSISSIWSINSNYELTTSYSLNDNNNNYAYDADWVNNSFCNSDSACTAFDFDQASESFVRDTKQNVLDVRLNSVNEKLVAGFYAKKINEDLVYQYNSAFFGNFASNSNYSAKRYALYGQYQLSLSDNLTLTTGLRFERYSDDYLDTNLFTSDNKENLWDGKISLEYYIDDTLVYASLKQSEKPGGVNTSASSNAVLMSAPFRSFVADKLRFDNETLLNKEVGLKRYFFDDALSLRAALFHTDRAQAQLESWIWDASAGLWIGYLDSTSDASNYGAEIETNYRASSDLNLFLSLGFLKTEVKNLSVFDLDANTFVSRNGRSQAKAPSWQYAVGGEYVFNSMLKLKVEFEGRDQSYYGYYHDSRLDGYNQIHASINYQLGDVNLTFWARNLTDEDYSVHGLYFAADARNEWQNEIYQQAGAPRTFGFNAAYSF